MLNGLCSYLLHLTSLYSVMHKLVVSNWLPSRNSTQLTQEQAFMLYKIVHLKKFNLDQIIFDNMLTFAGKHSKRDISAYPSLIYHFLERLEFARPKGEKISGYVASFGISVMLKSENRIVDLPLTCPI